MRPYRGLATLIAFGLILEAAFTASVPLAFRLLIDRAIVPRDTALLTTLVVAMTIGVVVVAAVGLWRDHVHARVCSLMLRDLRVQIFNQLHRLTPSSAGSDEGSGETAHFSTDLAAIEHAIVSAVAWALLPGLDVIIGTTLLFILEWRLALIAALVFPLAMIGPYLVAPRASRASRDRKNIEAACFATCRRTSARGRWCGPSASKRRCAIASSAASSPGRQQHAHGLPRRVGRAVRRHRHPVPAGRRARRRRPDGLRRNAHDRNTGVVSIPVHDGELVVVLCHAVRPDAGRRRGRAAAHRRLPRGVPPVADRPGAYPLPRCAREFASRASSTDFQVCRPSWGASISLRAGERVAIVGSIGSGKSTVLRLLARFADPDAGRIFIDGHDIRGGTQESLRRQIGVVFQDGLLLDDTIRENIRLGKLDAKDSEVEAVSALVGLHDIVEGLPRGYDTVVGMRGERLSGGQRQLVAIARAMLRDPAILLLDEPTSALDAYSDRIVRLAIEHVSRGPTVIAVTHRRALAAEADRVLVMKDGRLVEDGLTPR